VQNRAWKVYLGGASLAGLAYFLAPGLKGNGLFFNALGLSAAVAIVVGVRRNRPPAALAWWCFAAAQVVFVAGDLFYYSFDAPFPSLGDAFYLAFYPLQVVGLLLLVRRRAPGRDRASLIDACIITVGVGVLAWVFLMEPYAGDANLSLIERLVSMAYPLMDLLLLAVAARLAVGTGARPVAFHLLGGSILSLLVTDAIYGVIELTSGYNQGGLLDAGWLACYLLWGAAALHPSMHALSAPGNPPETRLSGRRLALLAVATLMAPSVQVVQDLRSNPMNVPVVAAASGVLFLLVLVRMAGLLASLRAAVARSQRLAQDSARLTRDLERRRSEERLGALVQNSSDVITVVHPDLTIRYQTPSGRGLLGHDPEALVGTSLTDLLHPDDAPRAMTFYSEQVHQPGVSPRGEWRLRHRDGSWVDAEVVSNNLLEDPNVEGIVLTIRDVRERKAFEEQLRHQAFHDGLTSLANRALFLNRLEHALTRREIDGARAGVLFVDIDDFQSVNDRLGHAAGDELLVGVAGRLQTCVRPADTPARVGGDEFAVLMAELPDDVEALRVAERILSALDEPFCVQGTEVRLRASIGVACATVGQDEGEAVLRNAEVAAYTAKSRGKGRCETFEPVTHRRLVEQLQLKADLQKALEQQEFVLNYQPIVWLETGRVAGVEALLRWAHTERGVVPPVEFIPLCEQTGLIVPIGQMVLEEACRQAKQWQTELPDHRALYMSVNLSAVQLQHPRLVSDVGRALAATGLEPGRLVLEITESTLVDDVDAAVATLRELKALGVLLAIDDFGTGYSSLSYLDRLPVDVLKIDRTFTQRITSDPKESALARAIIQLGPTLELKTVAEGIEEADQWETLRGLGCDLGQGYFFSRPLNGDAMTAFLATAPSSG
jgi:diguanylate cyclase (GGDEF)-like protein/PAS domain S-box-containing protein